MDVVFNLRGHTYYIDKAVVTPFSTNAGLISAASARTSYMAKREEKEQFDRYPRINLVASNLDTTERPSYHAQTASATLLAAIQTTLRSSISKQQLRAVNT